MGVIKPKRLTKLEKDFVNNFTGNIVETMKVMGKKGADCRLHDKGRDILRRPQVKEAMIGRMDYLKEKHERMMTAEEMLLWYSDLVRGFDSYGQAPPKVSDRLKASEMLGRAGAIFVDKKEIEHKQSLTDIIEASYHVEKKPEPKRIETPVEEEPDTKFLEDIL